MALDRQRILSELGSVMNQLKSADCGCMGRLFGDAGQTAASPSPQPTCGGCRRNCCLGHGYGWNSNASGGEPYPSNAQKPYSPCMGRCNPPKLYADTYNYLTENLLQPTIKEVYNDLKSLTPENSIANNPMAHKMGLIANGSADGNVGNMNTSNIGNMNAGNMGTMNSGNMGNVNAGNPYNNFARQPTNANDTNQNQMDLMGGMGPEIMNMVKSNSIKTSPNSGQNGQLPGTMFSDALQYPRCQTSVAPLSTLQTTNPDVYNGNAHGYSSGYNANQATMQQNMQHGGYSLNERNTNPAAQQMAAGNLHGKHSQGISKFNEMFPGVMNNTEGNLGFDPMAIAIQMNPANQQKAAMDTMNKIMNNTTNFSQPPKIFDQSANPTLLPGKGLQQNQIQNNVPPNQVEQSNPLQQTGNETMPSVTPTNQMTIQNTANIYRNPNELLNNQQVYTTVTGEPMLNQITSQSVQQQQNIIDPNTGSEMAPPTLSSAHAVPGQQTLNSEFSNDQRLIKEPIFPVDTSKYIAPRQAQYFEYNTLGQPVEKCSAKIFRTPEPTLPQTLSPQTPCKPRTNAASYSNVKSTVSKTSLMGAKLGRTPSQLQQIYNQYKGSQSYTQQNIKTSGVNDISHSEGKLNAPYISQQLKQLPVEKVGGDTVVENQMRDERSAKVEQVMGQIGDVSAVVKAMGDTKTDEVIQAVPEFKRKTRNGLQDMVYTSYPSSAWTFHGGRPFSPVRNKYIR